MTGSWYMIHEETLNFDAYAPAPEPGVSTDESPRARIVGVGAELAPVEDARALQARLAAEMAIADGDARQA